MKSMDLLTLLGELEETSCAPAAQPKKRRLLWGAAAACLCACILGFSAWFFLPPPTVTPNDQRLVVIRIDDRLVSYEILKTNTMSRFERMLLPDEPGEVLAVHGDSTFYRAAGEEDLVYLIQIDGNGKQTVLEFYDYVNIAGVDMTTSYWYESGWLTDEDIAALNDTATPTIGEIWEIVYSVTSHADIQSIYFEKDSAYNGGVSKKIKITPVTVKDSENLARIYDLLVCMTPAEYGQELPYDNVNAHDEAYLSGEKPLSAQVNRDLTVTLANGRTLTFYYYPTTGLLHQQGTRFYTMLPETDNEWLITLAEIDMAWQDWGTEKAYDGPAEGDETAVAPTAPAP